MLSIPRALRDYTRAGALNTMLAPWAFVDDHVFLTKTGAVGLVYRVTGADYECLDTGERRQVVRQCEAALRHLDERCRLYQYALKRRIAPLDVAPCASPVAHEAITRRASYLNSRRDDLYDIDLFFAIVYEGLQPNVSTSLDAGVLRRNPVRALGGWLSSSRVRSVLERDLHQAIEALYHRAAAFSLQLADTVHPVLMHKAETFRFFSRLVNYDIPPGAGTRLISDCHIDYFMAESTVDCHRGHLQVGRAHVKAVTMKEPPAATAALVLEELYTVPGEWIACLEWRRIGTERMRRDLRMRRRHYFNKRVSLRNYLSTEPRPEQEMLVDESASATVRQLGDALTELEVHGRFFGECSLTLVLHDDDPHALDRNVAEATKVLTARDAAVTRESYNLLNAWLSVVPGNSAHNVRRLALLDTNLADLSFLFTIDRGSPTCAHLGREALAPFETNHQTLYHFNLHVDDVGHGVILGATGSGKSFLCNFLITHAQRYSPITIIFDLGRGYQKLATLLQGSYLTLGLQQSSVRINPFALAPTPDHLHFLHGFARVLVEGRNARRISDAEDRELYDAIENLYVLAPEQRRLFTLANLLPRHLSQQLSPWISGGRYGEVFDHTEDTLTCDPFQVFDLEAMQAFPDLLEPLLFYVLHRASTRIQDPANAGVLKICLIDEAWRFIQHEQLRAHVRHALKTWRKHHAVMLLATQTIQDFASADLLRTVVENAPNKFLLANPGLDPDEYARLFQLNATEIDLVRDLLPRRQFLLKRPSVAKVLNLNVDPRSYGIYTNTPLDNERFTRLVSEYGFAEALDRFAAAA